MQPLFPLICSDQVEITNSTVVRFGRSLCALDRWPQHRAFKFHGYIRVFCIANRIRGRHHQHHNSNLGQTSAFAEKRPSHAGHAF